MKINFIRTLILSAILCAVTVSSAWSGLLGITPGVPNITFVNTNSAATSYSPATGLVTVTATPQLAMMISGSAPVPVLPPRSLTIALQIDQSGNLVGGVAGDDLVLTGTVYGTSYAGTLLTGEIVGFGIQNAASTIDYIDLRLKVTGGSMASLFAGNDIGVSLAMENSTFSGSFDVSFQGAAKGNLGPIPPLQICSGTIGDFIWNDANRNGVQDAGESGIDNVSVSLKDSSNTVVATKLSGPNGAYLFSGLCAGDYTVVVDTATLPAGFVASQILQGGDPVRDSNPNAAIVNLPTGTSSELTIDFGYNSPCSGSVGDLVWHDQNRNGIQDPGEPGLGTITVNLIDSLNNTPITSTTTDGSGKYLFSGMCAGNYRIEAVAPAGFVLSTPLQGGNIASDSNPNPSEVVLASDYSGEITIDFGFNTPCTGSIGDFVWNDLNRDGIQNSDEPGINNIRVWLKDSFSNLVAIATTTGNGFYKFGGLCAGTYRVEVDNSTVPAGMVASPANATDGTEDSNNSPAAVILDADNSSDPTVDFGYYSPCSGSIGDMVWLDANRDGIQNFGETGINGVTVALRDSANVVVAVTTSGLGPLGQAGFYVFTGLCSGSYTVEVVTPAGLQISDSLQGGDPATDSNGSPASVYLDSDYSTDPTIDFGFNPPCAGSIGNLVWDDLDRDGIQDPGEPGLDGVTVKLLTSANSQLSLTTTAGGGLYRFDGLCAGDYRVEVVPPAGRTASPVLAGLNRELDSNPNPFAVNLPADTSSDQSIDFGFNTPCSGSIGNLVWHDKNRDGIQDELEPGISGASVKLKNASGTVIASTNTDQQGGYLFGGLCHGDYSVEVVTPAGFVPSSSFQGSNIALDSNGSPAQVSLAADDSSDRSVDFGFNTPCAAFIGDLVWNDLNQNGIQDSGEPGIAGVVVNLRDSQHTLLRTTNTKADGSYEFIGLCSGDYKVEALTPAGMTTTAVEAAGDPEKDSNSNPAIVNISSDSVGDTSIDFGFFKPCSAALGDLVWNDLNRNGIQDANETGLAGAIVTLVGSNIYGMPVSKSFTTFASGAYQFTELCQGTYAISVSPPDGYTATMTGKGTPATDNNGSPFTVTMATDSSSDLTIDFGFFKPCSGAVGDFVWNDQNRDGIQDANEPGLAGVTVTLTGNDFYGMPVNRNFTTLANGAYQFTGLCQGTYVITAIAPDGYTAAPTGNGTAATDSNGTPSLVQLATDSSSDQTIDFGFSIPCNLCKDGVVYMTLKLEWRVSNGDTGERIRVRADSITGQILYDSWFDSISGNGIPVGTDFGFSVPASVRQAVVTVQGQYHPSETQKAVFSAECDLLIGQINGNSYITFKVVDARFDGEKACGTIPVIDVMKYASSDGKTWYRTDLDNVLKIALCPSCEQDFDKDHCDYDHDGKCDEKDIDYCRNNKSGCDRHDSEHGSSKRKHRCDASTNRTYCEDRARESHGRDHADYNRDGKCDEIDVDYCRNNKAACDRHDAYHGSTVRVFRCDDSSSRNLCESRRQYEIKSDKIRSDYNRDGKCDESDIDFCLNDRVACIQLDNELGNLKRRFRCDDSGNSAQCEDKAREEHDRNRADYDNDGKCDEKDMDFCRSNRAACDQHDRNHGNDRRKHRCDDSSDKGACEGRARQEHDRDRCDYNSDGKCDEKDIDHCESNKELCVKHDRDHLNCRRTFRCDDSYDKTACDAFAKQKHDRDDSDYNNDGRCDEKDVIYCKADPGRCDRRDNDHGLFRRTYRCDDSSSKDSCSYYAQREHGRDSDDYNRDGKCDEGDIIYCRSNPEECSKHDRGHGKLKRSYSCDDSANKTSCESTCVVEDRNDRDRSDYNRDGRCDERDVDFCRNNPASCNRFDGERGNLKRNFRCDDSYNKVSCESMAQAEHNRDYSDYNRDGKCDEKDIDHCRNNASDCDRHDRNRGGNGRLHRCDDSYDKTSCESRSREEHSRYEGCAGSGGTSASCGKVYYKFVVTDTGTTSLNDLTLVDSVHVTNSCAIPAVLQPGGSFSCVIGPFQALAGQHSNTATASGTFMGVTATASDNAYYFGCSGTVPKSPGYWKNNPEAWPVASITIGGRNYTKSQAIALMNSSVCGDKSYTLFKALVAAKLNAVGCGDSSCVTETITKAEAWMALHNVGSGVTGDSAAWKEAEPLYLILDDYDNGKACGATGPVGGCNQAPEPQEPSTPTCGACSGGVNRLTLMYKGWSTAVVTVKDSGGQTLYNANAAPNSSFSFTGKSSGGVMLQYVKIYVNGYHKATIYTDCLKSIYPGMGAGPFKVVEGYSLNGGKFCRITSSAFTGDDDRRHSKDYCDSHQGESSCTGFFNYNMDSGSRFEEIHLF